MQNLGTEVKTSQKYTVNKSNSGLSMVPWGTKTKLFYQAIILHRVHLMQRNKYL